MIATGESSNSVAPLRLAELRLSKRRRPGSRLRLADCIAGLLVDGDLLHAMPVGCVRQELPARSRSRSRSRSPRAVTNDADRLPRSCLQAVGAAAAAKRTRVAVKEEPLAVKEEHVAVKEEPMDTDDEAPPSGTVAPARAAERLLEWPDCATRLPRPASPRGAPAECAACCAYRKQRTPSSSGFLSWWRTSVALPLQRLLNPNSWGLMGLCAQRMPPMPPLHAAPPIPARWDALVKDCGPMGRAPGFGMHPCTHAPIHTGTITPT